jgi:hypothetical protein
VDLTDRDDATLAHVGVRVQIDEVDGLASLEARPRAATS